MKHGKALNWFLTFLFAAVMLFCMTLTAWADEGTIYYKYASGNTVSLSADEYAVVSESEQLNPNKPNVVNKDTAFDTIVLEEVTYDIILCDGCTLSANEINAGNTGTLIIYAGNTEESIDGTGVLSVNNETEGGNAFKSTGIGGGLRVNGGTVTMSSKGDTLTGFAISIEGGSFTATSTDGYAIGSIESDTSEHVKNVFYLEDMDVFCGDSADAAVPAASTTDLYGKKYIRIGYHQHDGVTFTPWTSDNSLPDSSSSGSYYLTKDVTLSGTWQVYSGTMNLCLNGHTIHCDFDGPGIKIQPSSSLNLYDCGTTGVIRHEAGKTGRGIYVLWGHLNMYGGTISSNSASGGEIDGNGAGVCIEYGTFNMYGGAITNNTASGNGGGVFYISRNADFSISGGTITGNTAAGNGGGVFSTRDIKLSGSPVISDNTSKGKANNVVVNSLRCFTITDQLSLPKSAAKPQIGVTTPDPSQCVFTEALGNNLPSGKTASDLFFSDDPGYVVTETSGGEAMLKPHLTITANDKTYTYNGGTQGPGGAHIEPAQMADTVTVKGPMDPGDELTDLIVGGQGDAAGDYTITPSAAVIENSGQDVTRHYVITYVPGKMTITPKQMNITVNGSGAEKAYNGKEQTVTGTVTATSSDAVFDASRFSYSGSVAASGKDAGEYTTVLSAGKCAYSDKSCNVSWTIGDPVRLTIQPKDVTIKAQDHSFAYDGTSKSWPGYDVDGLLGNDAVTAVVSGSITYPEESPVMNKISSYEFTKGDADNYSVLTVDGELTMTNASAEITITAASQKWTYDGKAHADSTVSLTSGKLFDGDTLTAKASGSVTNVADTAIGNNPVSEYKVMHGDTDVTDNYAVTAAAGKLTIDPKPATVTAADQTIKEGESIATGVDMATLSGAVSGHVLGAVTLAAQGKTIVPSAAAIRDAAGGDVTDNYDIEYKPGTLTVIKPEPKPEPTPPEPTPPEPTPVTKIGGTAMVKMTAKGSDSLQVSWSRIRGADGYDVFFARCNANGKDSKCKKVKTINDGNVTSWTKTGLTKGAPYKAYVKAYVMKNGKKKYVKKTFMVHAFTGGSTKHYTNARGVKVKKARLTLQKKETFKIKAKIVKLKKGKQLMPADHVAKLRYLSTNRKVATVSKTGKIKAWNKGKCTIYVIAHNGVRKAIRVKVK